MPELQTLAHLQEIDLQIEAETVTLRETEAALRGDPAVAAARTRVEEARERVLGLERRLRELEWDAEKLTGEIAKDEERLYGGRVRNPKELDQLQKDLDQRKGRRRHVEDDELEVMTSLEARQSEAKAAEAGLAGTEAAWREQEGLLQAKQTQTQQHLQTLRDERTRLLAEVTPATLTLYERLRREKRGRAVSRIDRSMCLACRIALPAGVVAHVRQGRETVFCPSCGRILTL
ncbi:MAG TPA: C4-type zinc ribbon domain-containing protein [Chloroflexota bacterium]|nr:C4-type zinc ribbon domain-containing protein [Chloroflexota bacterium]